MKAISRWLDRFCYDHPNFGIPELMKYIAVGNVIVFVLDIVTRGYATMMLMFSPSAVLHGQIWRLFTFILIPLNRFNPSRPFTLLWFVMSTFFYYWLGTSLERQWGTTRFNVFYFLGVVLNLILGFVLNVGVSMYYVNMSLFFSFATLYPDMQVLLYGILPLKVKWLAWFDVALFGYDIVSNLLSRAWAWALLPVVAILNYLIFFWDAGPRPGTGSLPDQPPDHPVQKGPKGHPAAQGLPPQMCRLRHHRRRRPQHGVPLLLQMQRLLLLLHEAYQ